MKIIYGGSTAPGATAEHRLRAFRRLCPDVVQLDYDAHLAQSGTLQRRVVERAQTFGGVAALNMALLDLARNHSPSLVWLDKPIYFWPRTIAALARVGARVVAYNPDDPFGPRNDGVWRLFKKSLSNYWAHVVPREVTRNDLFARGVCRVAIVPFAFEPSLHFPPADLGISVNKDCDVSFVGYPHDDRANWIKSIILHCPQLRFGLFGPGWNTLSRPTGLAVRGPVWNDVYRDVIWRSHLSLSFITRSNRDEMSHKAIEIAASGTPVVAERSRRHQRIFADNESAFFFSDPSHLPQIVFEALKDRDRLARMGRAASNAVRAAKLDNDAVLSSCLAELGITL